MNVTHLGLVCLLKSAVTGKTAELPEKFSLEEAIQIAAKQSVLPLIFQGARNCGLPQNHPMMQKMLLHSYQQMVRSERQMRGVQQLFDAFEENGIDYMPLKGCNMKQLYPKPELRSMGDADILIRTEQLTQCEKVMKGLGFVRKLESEHTDNWASEDLYVELHKSLVPAEDAEYYAYYGTGWRIGRKGAGHRYDPSPEDTFIFLFTHFARHYRISGIGCRHVVDLYVFRSKYPDLNEKYIREELKKLHLLEFYENVLRMLDVWFGNGEPDGIVELMTAFIFSGGSWGTMEASLYAQEVQNAHRKGAVGGSFVNAMARAIFPPLRTIRNRYPVLRRAPLLLPAMWVVRWFDVALFSRKKLKQKMQILRGMDDRGVLTYHQSLQAVGLDYHCE